MFKLIRSIKFLFTGPFILLMLFGINLIFTPDHWWVQWPALGIGIAWFICLFRVGVAVIVAGGIAAFITHLTQSKKRQS